jgi:eukaryotic-like serine/threonine-protein kinase
MLSSSETLQRAVAVHFGGQISRIGGMQESPLFVVAHGRLGASIEVRLPGDREGSRTVFDAELELLQTFRHAHIVQVVEHGSLGGVPFYAVPHRPTLDHRLSERKRRLPLDQAMRVLTDTAAALAYCHERGIVHCILSPYSIRLDVSGALLDDFWFAASYSRLLQAGPVEFLVIGNPTYLSPELCHGRPVNGRSDLYNLGAVVFECLFGEPPHIRASELVAAKQQVPTFPAAGSPLQTGLYGLLSAMLDPTPAARPQSAQDVRDQACALAACT